MPTPNPTPVSLREAFEAVRKVVNEAPVVPGVDWFYELGKRLARLDNAIGDLEAPEPPAVRCAGNEDRLRSALADIVCVPFGEDCNCETAEDFVRWAKSWASAALSAPVPQPPAGNEEALELMLDYVDLLEAHDAQVKMTATTGDDAPAQSLREPMEQAHDKAWAAVKALARQRRAALSAPVPQPPAGNEELDAQSSQLLYDFVDGTKTVADLQSHVMRMAERDLAKRSPSAAQRLGVVPFKLKSPELELDIPTDPACNGTGKATACPHGCVDGANGLGQVVGDPLGDRPLRWRPCWHGDPANKPADGHGKREGDR